ncbi:MAG: hypothetical protein IJ938_05185 [Clostridia bacterium]|nr:hypothetical protein [Clostridia bacterium]MBR2070171.1 hypothetical protein [Clostridia bacterium]MBR2160692.1 hypothetical protein [Clostridia bacterium]MBR2324139.1 hypothetical protein [Clostridia bacterium]MBR2397270.1 hypothetical protein [Clostridia bacterium]
MIKFIGKTIDQAESLAKEENKKVEISYLVDRKTDGQGVFLCIRAKEEDGVLKLVFSNFKL